MPSSASTSTTSRPAPDAVCLTALASGDQIQITVNAGLLPDGAHRLFVRMVSSGDVKGPAVSVDFSIDTSGPVIFDLKKTVPDDDDTPKFEWTAVDDLTAVDFQRVHMTVQR